MRFGLVFDNVLWSKPLVSLKVNECIAKIKGLTSKFASQDLPAFPKSAEDPDSSWVSWHLRAQGRLCSVLPQILLIGDNPLMPW